MNSQLSQFLGAKVEAQRALFASGATLPLSFRREQLRRLATALDEWEGALCDALWKDLHKSPQEAILTELSIVRGEIRNHLRHLGRWTCTRRPATPLKMFPSRSSVMTQPLGSALIIAPWNYPVQLLLNPLVGAISAGCTAMLKTSPAVPHVAQVLVQMIGATFPENYVAAIDGHREVNTALLEQRFDIIFFTGSPALGKVVMASAARTLTPVVLELGGKSPTIVDRGANVAMAARRIAWGKTLNAGQTCIAPDYLMIHSSLKEEFVAAFEREVHKLHGADIALSPHYGRMVSDKAFERVSGYLANGRVLVGGATNAAERYIEPTLLEVSNTECAVMQEEIFGPILPLITFDNIDQVREFVCERPHPLAFYYFGPKKQGKALMARAISGGACLNDTIMHIANERVPFGGVGASGMGRYHGRESLLAFSHQRSVVATSTAIDLPFRYMPYKLWGLVKRLL
ncbi:MAG: aldehyde dehydrogenase family protein [Tidjanibacter sp.]|nr:aldehyde dehydrogenase family protein [Tidjanibacter sp.]